MSHVVTASAVFSLKNKGLKSLLHWKAEEQR